MFRLVRLRKVYYDKDKLCWQLFVNHKCVWTQKPVLVALWNNFRFFKQTNIIHAYLNYLLGNIKPIVINAPGTVKPITQMENMLGEPIGFVAQVDEINERKAVRYVKAHRVFISH